MQGACFQTLWELKQKQYFHKIAKMSNKTLHYLSTWEPWHNSNSTLDIFEIWKLYQIASNPHALAYHHQVTH